MAQKGFKLVALCLVAWLLPSCGADKKLVSINVNPTGANITGVGVNVQFTALGNYIHPPETQDITSKVVWKSSAPQVIDFKDPSQPGLATSQGFCGTNITISATYYSNQADPTAGTATVGTASASVTIPGCS